MKKKIAALFALIGWFAIIGQYVLSIENRVVSVTETTIRFFSFFTILINLLVAIYFTWLWFAGNNNSSLVNKPGTLTAITVYITIVGVTYQFALRHVWNPQGMQMLVNELLHSVIPVLVIIFWYLYERKRTVAYARIGSWAILPLAYLGYSLVRGNLTGYYPYYFIDVTKLGLQQVLINAGIITVLFLAIAALFIFIGKRIDTK